MPFASNPSFTALVNLYDVGVKSSYSTLKILHKHTIFLPL